MFDKVLAQHIFDQLCAKGLSVKAGLKEDALKEIEDLTGYSLPSDIRVMLSTGVLYDPQDPDAFPDWHGDIKAILEQSSNYVINAFLDDIDENEYWSDAFGNRPDDTLKAKEQARAFLLSLPPMIRIYEHRYVPVAPSDQGNPVFSIWQATDSIYYGYDLAAYFEKEFSIKVDVEKRSEPKYIPVWSDLLIGD